MLEGNLAEQYSVSVVSFAFKVLRVIPGINVVMRLLCKFSTI